jgi:hypothetical protein
MKFKVDGKIFSSSGEAYEYCIENDISIEKIEEIEEDSSEENERGIIYDSEEPEENLGESEIPDYEDVSESERTQIIFENWNEIKDETLKAMILSIAMGNELGQEKKFSEKETTAQAIPNHVRRIIERLADSSSRICPICSMEITSQEIATEDNVMAKILHVKKEHPEILTAYSKIVGFPKQNEPFETTESERAYDDKKRDDSESCSKSKEELTMEIVKDPSLRKKLIDEWIKSQRKSD